MWNAMVICPLSACPWVKTFISSIPAWIFSIDVLWNILIYGVRGFHLAPSVPSVGHPAQLHHQNDVAKFVIKMLKIVFRLNTNLMALHSNLVANTVILKRFLTKSVREIQFWKTLFRISYSSSRWWQYFISCRIFQSEQQKSNAHLYPRY